MANEATLYIQTGLPIPFTVANGTAITKGAILRLTSPFTASAGADLSGSNAQAWAGIAAVDKIANSGEDKLAVYREGFFKGVASGSITAGDPVAVLSGSTWPNLISSIKSISRTGSGSSILGIACSSCSTTETFIFELKPQILCYTSSDA